MPISEKIDLIRAVIVKLQDEEENERENVHIQRMSGMKLKAAKEEIVAQLEKSRRTSYQYLTVTLLVVILMWM